jgi:hypothetical protein
VRQTPAAVISSARRPIIDWPPSSILPSVGGKIPVIALKNVVFPAPLGPISPKISPSSMCSVTFDSALRPPNCWVTFSALSILAI